MKLLNNIRYFFRKNPVYTRVKSLEYACPNCWGRQEYGGEFYKALKTDNPAVMEQKKGWVRSYAERNLKGMYPKYHITKEVCNVCFQSYAN
ncbi:hypothetical protein ACOCEA_13180 [Maribacter sp. CXY002]|uniref:hypothetical protein n=1 Tax=Maribacter luteocoastalis TaxID=3407671 RepID=UPI003B6847F5